MAHCPSCGHDSPPEAKFCAECGTKLPRTCRRCGTPAVDVARFCTECGARLESGTVSTEDAPSAVADHDGAERRQLTIVFCDLVGSTRLATELDPEDLRELNRAYRKLCAGTIQRYDGYVARYMGDGVLAYFGYPRAHEDDAARAVRASLEIASQARDLAYPDVVAEPLAVRVGIATGPVVVGELIGEGAAQEHDVVGETPNLAARLQGLAAANSVVIGQETRKLLGAAFELEGLGAHRLKGFTDPVPAWRVVDTASVESRFDAAHSGGLTPFVGREHEVSLILDRWRQAMGEEGQVILLSGEPGIGKSRITRAVRDRLEPDDYVTVRYQCSPYHQSSALYPSIEHVGRAAGFISDDTPDARLDKLEQLLELPENTKDETMALFASLLSIPCANRYPVLDIDPEVRRERTLRAIADGFESLAARHPLLVLIEDVHWADPTTLVLLDILVERVQSWRAVILISFRPEFDAPWVGQAHVALSSLSRLDRRQCEAMVGTLTGGKTLPDEIVDQITLKTDGVPLFVEELTTTILETGLVTERAGRYVLSGPMQPLAIPTTLQDSLMARLDQLDDAKSIAQIGAAIGREFPHALLAFASGRSDKAIGQALTRLVGSGLVFRRGTGPRASYVFKHALVRDAAYNSMLKSRRHALHGRIAAALAEHFPDISHAQPELVAHHYSAAKLGREALPFWRQAGQHAMERSAHREAIAHFRQGLDILGNSDMQSTQATQAIEFQTAIAECLRIVDRIDEAFTMLKEAREIAVRFELTRHLAGIHYQRGNLYFPMAKIDECLTEHQQSLEHARNAASIDDEVRALGGLGDAYYVRGQMRTAKLYFERCVTLAREHGFARTAAANLSMLGFSRAYLLEFREAMQDGLDATAMAVEVGHPRAQLLGEIMAAWISYYMADYARGIQYCEQATDTARRLGARRFEPQNNYYQALCLHRLGRSAAAMALLDEAEPMARQFSPSFVLPRLLSGIALITDDSQRRDRALAEGQRLLDAGAVSHNYFAFYLDAVDSSFDRAEWGRVDEYASRMEQYAQAEPVPWSDFVVARARTLATWGRGERNANVFEQLHRLHDEAQDVGWLSSLSRIELALESEPPARVSPP